MSSGNNSNAHRRKFHGSGSPEIDPGGESTTTSYKRRRIALACTSCRNRKSRCDGAKPSCSLCVELGFECIYQYPTAGSAQRNAHKDYDQRFQAIENALNLLLQQRGEGPPSRPVLSEVVTPTTLYASDLPPIGQDVVELNEHGYQQVTIDEDSVDGMAAITDSGETELRFFGPSSNIALLREISDATSTALRNVEQRQNSRTVSGLPLVSRSTSPVPEDIIASPNNVGVFLLPSEAQFMDLSKLFFSNPGMLFPYIHEETILRSYATAKGSNFSGVSRSWLALINMMFALATYTRMGPNMPTKKNVIESKIYFERAEVLSKDIDLKKATIETVQFLLLMNQYRQGTQHSGEIWNLHGLTVRLAIQLGLHSKSASNGFSPLDKEIRKRTWFACMILDRILSMTFGRPPAIPGACVRWDLPLNQSLQSLAGPENYNINPRVSESPDTVCLFISTIELYNILGDILSGMYGNNLEDNCNASLPDQLKIIIGLEQDLCAWQENLPSQMRRTPWRDPDFNTAVVQSSNSVFDRFSVIITLRFLNAKILLHRPILSIFIAHQTSARSSMRNNSSQYFISLGERSLEVCRTASMEVIDIVHRMSKLPFLLGAWWFSAYYTFNASLVIFSCILLKLRSPCSGNLNDESSSSENEKESDVIIDMIKRLNKAIEALGWIYEGTRSTRRIRKTLVKLIQICTVLAQLNANHGPLILSSDCFKNILESLKDHDLTTTSLQDRDDDPWRDGPIFPAFDTGDPLLTMDLFAPNGLDLFTNLGGMESSLTSLGAK